MDPVYGLQNPYGMPATAGYGPGVDYSQARYGMGPTPINALGPGLPTMVFPYANFPVGPVPGPGDGLRPFSHMQALQPGAEALQYDSDAAALADSFQDQLHLNPGAKEYVPNRRGGNYYGRGTPLYYAQSRPPRYPNAGRGGRAAGVPMGSPQPGRGQAPRKRKTQKGLEDNVKRTVYISYIDQQVTEELLANVFSDCGKVIDCRICGDPNSAMRFAFIEFTESEAATRALSKTGSVLGSSPIRVLPSKTAIVPVNKELMPRSNEDVERCSRTVYAANIDKKVDRNDVKHFFEQLCGRVAKIRLLGDYAHSTRIAFIEFTQAEGAMAALNCSGALLGSLPVRVSPSKTPVRVESKDGESS